MRRITVEITMVVDDIGTTQTQYFATSGFTTRSTETPANTYFAPRIKSAGSYKRELFSGTRVFGAVRPSFGELVLFNGDGGLDEWMGYGISGGKVVVRMGEEDAAYPAEYTTIYIAYAQHLIVDFNEIRVRVRDRINLLERPLVTAQFAGTGGIEGTAEMAGKLKQWVSHDPGWFPPVLIDPALQLYYVQSSGDGGIGYVLKAYEGAMEITRSTDYPDSATLISTAPSAGQCRWWIAGANGPIYFRLGSVPQFDMRVYTSGYNGYSAWSMRHLAAMCGINDYAGAIGYVGAIMVDDDRTVMSVMEQSCPAAFQFFGMTRLDLFTVGTMAIPAATSVYTFTQHNAKNWLRQPVQDMDAPVWNVTINAGKTWKSNLVAGATAANKEYLSRDPWWWVGNKTDATIQAANPGAVAVTVEIEGKDISNTTDQTNFTNTYFSLYGVRRDFYTCTVPMDATTIAIELHDTVEIKMPRFGLSAGKKMRVITQQIDCDRQSITFGMWG